MLREDCPYLEEVTTNGEKVKACRVSNTAVQTYFSCDNCKRYPVESGRLKGIDSLKHIVKGDLSENPVFGDIPINIRFIGTDKNINNEDIMNFTFSNKKLSFSIRKANGSVAFEGEPSSLGLTYEELDFIYRVCRRSLEK